MQIIKIEAGEQPCMIELENTLEEFQGAVGGYIEAVTLPRTGLVVIVNEEGRLLGLPANGRMNIGPLRGQTLVGPVLVVRADPKIGDFAGVRHCDLELIRACWEQA